MIREIGTLFNHTEVICRCGKCGGEVKVKMHPLKDSIKFIRNHTMPVPKVLSNGEIVVLHSMWCDDCIKKFDILVTEYEM